MQDFAAMLRTERLVAIVRGSSMPASLATVLALARAGIRLIEVSLTAPGAAAVIRDARRLAGPGIVIGAGTVLSAAQAAEVADAGAQFVVTPGLGAGVAAALDHGLPVLAGVLTPSEVIAAAAAGVTAVKLFPASLGGPAYLRALRDPFPEVPFVPVGGVDTAAAARYLEAGAAAVGVGSPLVGDAASGGDLTALAGRARELLAVTRPGSPA